MQLTVWTYEGPPHVGAMRIATAMKGVHYVLHAPQGDTYADLLFTMIERRGKRPPVTYTTFQARDLGGDTAELFKASVRDAYERFKPEALMVGASCTAELIQDDPGGLASTLGLPVPVVPLELPAYQKKENWGAAETFYRMVRAFAGPHAPPPGVRAASARCRHSVTRKSSRTHGARLPPSRRRARSRPSCCGTSASWSMSLRRSMPRPLISPVSARQTSTYCCIRKSHAPRRSGSRAASSSPSPRPFRSASAPRATSSPRWRALAGVDPAPLLSAERSRLPWYSRSVDSNYLTGKAGFHLRRCHPCARSGPHRRRRARFLPSSASAPIPANSPARSGKRPRATVSRP